jgi:hypothetical protein
LTREAAAVFRSFAEAVYARLPNASGAHAAMLSKLPSLAARLALVHYVVRQAGRETRLPDTVDATSMRAGIAMATWADHEQRRIYSLLLPDGGTEKTTDDANRLAKWLAKWLDERGGIATGRDLARGPRWLRDERRKAAESRLISEGRAVREMVNTGGRPTVALRLLTPATGAFGTKNGLCHHL